MTQKDAIREIHEDLRSIRDNHLPHIQADINEIAQRLTSVETKMGLAQVVLSRMTKWLIPMALFAVLTGEIIASTIL